MSKIYHYFVEGECEELMIKKVLKQPPYGILSGKVEVFNFINREITNLRLLQLKPGTHIILVYDTDVEKTDILRKNIANLKKAGFKNIYHIHSVKNFEEELVYSSEIKNIQSFFNTKSRQEFKSKFIHANPDSLIQKLKNIGFSMARMWSRQGQGPFLEFDTESGIKLIKPKNKR